MDATVAIFLAGYREVHQRLRAELDALDPALVHVSPAPEANSIAVLVLHTLGSAGDVLRVVAGLPSTRDRTVEFSVTAADLDLAGLRARLDDADRLLDETFQRITAERLQMTLERPPRPPRTGLGWLVNNHGHCWEHVAHLELTRQLLTQPAS
ncbi:MAG: DinB family protein [Chloroflexi bacterium]|nr:DinB family protein [Chloroflexota bacterium]